MNSTTKKKRVSLTLALSSAEVDKDRRAVISAIKRSLETFEKVVSEK